MFRSRKDILGFDDRKMMLVGIPIVGLMVNAILFGYLITAGEVSIFSQCMIVAFCYTAFYWLVFRELHLYFIKKYPKYADLKRRLMVMIPAILIVFGVIKLILTFTLDPAFHNWMGSLVKPHQITEIISSFLLLTLIITIYETKYLAHQLRISQLEKEQLVKENISSQLQGLRNQVNPHFLFNSLNTLTSIISENQEKAIQFVARMSKVYRYILEIKDQKIIPLKEELEFLDSYTFLLKERFGDNIDIQIQIAENSLDQYIVPLSLQILFENAIKHNIVSADRPLHIQVIVDDLQHLTVCNNFQKKNTSPSSTQVGLDNIKSRYKFFTDEPVEVIQNEEIFQVRIPLLSTTLHD